VLTYGLLLWISGFFHAGELDALRDIQRRAMRGKAVRPATPEPEESEMAGEIVSGAPVAIADSGGSSGPSGLSAGDASDRAKAAGPSGQAGPPAASAEVPQSRITD
jgi:hypothetical protein